MTKQDTNDVVGDLRDLAELVDSGNGHLTMFTGRIFTDAADEIERIRGLISELFATEHEKAFGWQDGGLHYAQARKALKDEVGWR